LLSEVGMNICKCVAWGAIALLTGYIWGLFAIGVYLAWLTILG